MPTTPSRRLNLSARVSIISISFEGLLARSATGTLYSFSLESATAGVSGRERAPYALPSTLFPSFAVRLLRGKRTHHADVDACRSSAGCGWAGLRGATSVQQQHSAQRGRGGCGNRVRTTATHTDGSYGAIGRSSAALSALAGSTASFVHTVNAALLAPVAP